MVSLTLCYTMTARYLCRCLLETLLGRLPVDDVPDGVEVLSLSVLVLKVVGVLPGVDAQNGPELAHDRVLVRVRLDLDAAGLGVLHQPCPAATLDAGQGSVELALECVQASVALVDGAGELAGRRLAAALGGGREVFPEEGVVDVAAAVEVDQGLQSDLGLDVVLGLCLGDLLAEVVVRCHVGVVVVLVVELHDLATDGGLKSAIVVWKGLVRQRAMGSSGGQTYMQDRAGWLFRARRWCRRCQRGQASRARRRAGPSGGRLCGGESSSWRLWDVQLETMRQERRQRRERRRPARIITTLSSFAIARASELSQASKLCAGPMASMHGPATSAAYRMAAIVTLEVDM